MRVMTLNINGYGVKHGPWRLRRELIARAVETARPDVVAFQAVKLEPALEEADQASQIARMVPECGFAVLEPAAVGPAGAAEGQAFLSRRPPEETASLRLSVVRGDEDRTSRLVFRGLFLAGAERVSVFNAHFSWIDRQNERNIREAVAFLGAFRGPALLAGDFNAPPGSKGLAALASAGWTDLWAALKPRDPGFTFEADRPDRRIDYVWASPELKAAARSIDVVSAPANSEGARLSDHLGLVAEIG